MDELFWYKAGWIKAHKMLTGAKGSTQYPTQDKYSRKDEKDYCKGYNDCLEFYESNSFETVKAYADERDGL